VVFFTAGLWCSPLGFVCAFVVLLLVFVGLVHTSLSNTPTTRMIGRCRGLGCGFPRLGGGWRAYRFGLFA